MLQGRQDLSRPQDLQSELCLGAKYWCTERAVSFLLWGYCCQWQMVLLAEHALGRLQEQGTHMTSQSDVSTSLCSLSSYSSCTYCFSASMMSGS